jgi:helicase, putative, RecD/TraA family
MENYIMGTYKQSIFTSDKGYIIGLFRIKDTDIESMKEYCNKTITFTGYFHELNENENYYFFGEDGFHPKYGFQFNVKNYERVKPEDKDGIVEFLCSDLFKGVGEKLAKSIVDILGSATLETILNDKSSLLLVPKITMKKADTIYETLVKYEESHKTIVYLTELGFPMRDALLIYNTYKGNTMMILEHNIYRIMDDIEEISFPKIDVIVRKKEIDIENELRIKACIYYIMKELTFKNGDTYLNISEICEGVCNYLKYDVDIKLIDELLCELNGETKVFIVGDKYYLNDIYEAQYNIINKVKYLVDKEKNVYKKLDKEINEMESLNTISYNEKQAEAIKKALENNIVIITGGPGTGKTTIIKAIVELYKNLNKYKERELLDVVSLLAPTGRASKRMSESTNIPASTIHRFLKWNKDTNKFGVNEYNPDFSQLIIIDEVSMIDIALFDSLLKGLTDNIQLVLVGDYNQLPSVGPGMILKDLIDSKIIEVIELDLLYRQKENSYIPELAREIKNNSLGEYLETRDDYTFLKCSSGNIIPNLEKLCMQILDKGYDYKKLQLMAPMYAGVNGIDNLNKRLQEIFNPKSTTKNEIRYGDIIFRENDKVLQLLNMPDDNVFNGDIGIISSIRTGSSTKNEVIVDFDGNLVSYQIKDLINIKHGFIISIHKSQGSEFDIVVIPISKGYQRMLYKKLIYTGITRAKQKLILIGEPEAFEFSVNNTYEQVRKTDLLETLVDYCIN